jgi:predicted amidohydrolase YtcJ
VRLGEGPTAPAGPEPRTTLLRGGRVRSPVDPRATAMLVAGATVRWVGSGAAAESVAADEIVELAGALVTPAFVDAHVHSTATGLALGGLDLREARSLAQVLDAVERAARASRGRVLLATGWDERDWPERRPPTAAELDRASYGGVVYLSRVDVHSAVVSSALLAACPPARALPGFHPSGLVRSDAHDALRRTAYGAISPAQRRAAQRITRSRAAALGIGCLHEMAGPDVSSAEDLADLLALAAAEPGPDVTGYWAALGDVDTPTRLGIRGAGGDLYCDGTLGSHTAALSAPYADDPANAGILRHDATDVEHHVLAAVAAGLQPGFHVIGNAAVDAALAGLERASQRCGVRSVRAARPRLEHVEMASFDAIRRMAALGVVASVQPAFDAAWGGPAGMYAERLGADRAAGLNPFAAFATAGVPLALGSDAPVTPLDPWGGVRAAVGHRSAGAGLSARAAFAAATRGGWRAAGEDGAGELVPGAPATYAVWSAGDLRVQLPDERVAGWSTDPRAAVPGLPDLGPGRPLPRCVRTVVRGQTVFTAAGAA